MPRYHCPASETSGRSASVITRKYEASDIPSQKRRKVSVPSASGTRLMLSRNRLSMKPACRCACRPSRARE
jgi:hypothetical protein